MGDGTIRAPQVYKMQKIISNNIKVPWTNFSRHWRTLKRCDVSQQSHSSSLYFGLRFLPKFALLAATLLELAPLVLLLGFAVWWLLWTHHRVQLTLLVTVGSGKDMLTGPQYTTESDQPLQAISKESNPAELCPNLLFTPRTSLY